MEHVCELLLIMQTKCKKHSFNLREIKQVGIK